MSVTLLSRVLKEKRMSEILFLLAIFLIWLLLQAYILPKFGVST